MFCGKIQQVAGPISSEATKLSLAGENLND